MSKKIDSLPARTIQAGNCFFCDRELADIKVVIGLGNPGPQFDGTRHNIGFDILDCLADQLGFQFSERGRFLEAVYASSQGRKVEFYKPQTFMNNSGQIIPMLSKDGVKPEQILVVHDELEKDLGHLSLKFGGSARGHNGLRSIIGSAGYNFWRMKFGVGRPEEKSEVSNFVLSRFRPTETDIMGRAVDEAVDFFCCTKTLETL